MIQFKTGNIFNENVQAIVNPVNCVGVMGKGLALQFKTHFPNNFIQYKETCLNNNVKLGKMFVTKTESEAYPHYIINFPTKYHWSEKSKISHIKNGLNDLISRIIILNIDSIAIPPLGCGLGGLYWHDVKPIMVSAFKHSESIQNTHIIILEP